MSDESNATPQDELRRYITDSNIPKNEREWWAHHEIDRLSRDLAAAREDIEILREANAAGRREFEAARRETEEMRARLLSDVDTAGVPDGWL